jgi:Protein of unknown function (DUF3099)
MAIRTVCFVGAIIASLAGGPTWLWAILIAGALVLPYVAVVMANATSSKGDGFALLGTGGHRELGSGPDGR